MSAKKAKMQHSKMENTTNTEATVETKNLSVAELKTQLAEMQQQKEAFQTIASIAAQNLIGIETRFAPLLARKFNFFTALFHLQQYILLIKEIIDVIKDFREKYVQKTNPV